MSRVVIFGGNGFVGKALMSLLDKYGIPYIAPSSQGIDLTDFNCVRSVAASVEDGDTVVMLAVLTQEKGDIRDTTLKNVMMARNLLKGIEGKNLNHLVYVSSDSVYGKAWEMIDSATPVCPDTLYGYMHAMREQYFKEYFPSLTILRPCAIYGIGDTHNSYGVNRFIREAVGSGEISLFGDGEEYRANIHVSDVARIILQSITDKVAGSFNVVSGKSWRFSEIAELIKNSIGKDVKIITKPRTTPITHRHFDNSELLGAFFQPRSPHTGVPDMLENFST